MNTLCVTIRHPQFRTGWVEMMPVSLGIAAWGRVTGLAMVKSGLSVPLALMTTLTVFAGSVQLTAVPLMMAGSPAWVIWATALCVNLRFARMKGRSNTSSARPSAAGWRGSCRPSPACCWPM